MSEKCPNMEKKGSLVKEISLNQPFSKILKAYIIAVKKKQQPIFIGTSGDGKSMIIAKINKFLKKNPLRA